MDRSMKDIGKKEKDTEKEFRLWVMEGLMMESG